MKPRAFQKLADGRRANPLQKWIAEMRPKVGQPQVDHATHVPTENELNNVCYLSMKWLAGWQMRTADFAVVQQLGGACPAVAAMATQWLPALGEYIWDHIMGEPEDFTAEDVIEGCALVRDLLFAMGEHDRNAI